jgi:hypothetical protein
VLERIERVRVFVPLFTAGTACLLKCSMCWSTYAISREDATFLVEKKDDPALSYTPKSTVVPPPGSRQRRGL